MIVYGQKWFSILRRVCAGTIMMQTKKQRWKNRRKRRFKSACPLTGANLGANMILEILIENFHPLGHKNSSWKPWWKRRHYESDGSKPEATRLFASESTTFFSLFRPSLILKTTPYNPSIASMKSLLSFLLANEFVSK